jgi:predicted ester cyclase
LNLKLSLVSAPGARDIGAKNRGSGAPSPAVKRRTTREFAAAYALVSCDNALGGTETRSPNRSEVDSIREEAIMNPKTTSITAVAEAFFEACETGKGWEVCSTYCAPNATFSAQAEPLLDVRTLAQYTDWMKGILTVLPDAHYEVKSFATDSTRNNVAAYGIFYGTHTGQGGPVPPTGRRISTDYVYVMQFEGNKIVHMTKIWNAGLALKDLGWA